MGGSGEGVSERGRSEDLNEDDMMRGGRRSDDGGLRPDQSATAERREGLSEEGVRVAGMRGEEPMEAQTPRDDLRTIRLAAEVTYKPETSSHEVSFDHQFFDHHLVLAPNTW